MFTREKSAVAHITTLGTADNTIDEIGLEITFGDEKFQIAAGSGTAGADAPAHFIGTQIGDCMIIKNLSYFFQCERVDALWSQLRLHFMGGRWSQQAINVLLFQGTARFQSQAVIAEFMQGVLKTRKKTGLTM